MAQEREDAVQPEGEEQPEEQAQAQAPEQPREARDECGGPPRRPPTRAAQGRAYIKSTFNNTIISITDQRGNVVTWASGGTVGFKGTRKGTPFAAQLAAENAARRALDLGLRRIDVFTRGPGSGRETAIRAMQAVGIEVGNIQDVTPHPHNGCRPKKRRRM